MRIFELAIGRERPHSGGMSGDIWNTLCKLIGAAAIAALTTAAASAQTLQMPGIDISPGGRSQRVLTPEEKEKQRELDEKYKATMEKIPNKQAPADPWGNIRSAPTTTAKQR